MAEHGNIYFKSAQVLGHKNLRAGLWLLLNKDHLPSLRLSDALETWANIKPVIIQAPPGSNIFGDVGLIDFGQVVDVLILSLGEVDPGLIISCKICGRQTFKRSGTQKFCRQHSWSTKEGRRYHRQQRRANA